MRIGIDVMGGDYAPDVVLAGVDLIKDSLPKDVELVLYGNADVLERYKNFGEQISVVITTEIIEMSDHPSEAFRAKPDSSIVVGFNQLVAKEIDSFASVGNTGAMLVGAMLAIKPIPGVLRPAIAGFFPNGDKTFIIVDAGLNADCTPEMLLQFAELGDLASKYIYNIDNPRIALLNIGAEPTKGNKLMKATHEYFIEKSKEKNINFIGNVEGSDLFRTDKADVVVCDGYTGNITLKIGESIYDLVTDRGWGDSYLDKFNYENFGGTPVLGVAANVIVGHGRSTPKAIVSLIEQSIRIVRGRLVEKVITKFATNG